MTVKYDITSDIDTKIAAMVTPTYNFNYGTVNVHKPDDKIYPDTITEYKEEEFLDPDEQMVDSYSGFLTAKFKVMVDDSVSPPRLALSQVLEDFERLLENIFTDLQAKGQIVTELMEDIESFTNVRKRPGMIEMEWRIFYRVKRSDPSTTI